MNKLRETFDFIVQEIGKGSPFYPEKISFTGIKERLQELWDCAYECGQEDAQQVSKKGGM